MAIKTISVSVIIPCYRCVETIERALKSLYVQTVKPLEIILVDDFSCDGTLEKIKTISKSHLSGWIKVVALEKNMGPGSARNAGWDIAKSDYVAFLDADDSWHPKKLEIQYFWMIKHPEVSITGHRSVRFGLELPDQSYDFIEVSPTLFLFSNKFPTRSVMLNTRLLFRFSEGKKYSEDYLLWLQILLNGHEGFYSKSILAFSYKANFGGAGLSSDLWAHQKGELLTYRAIYIQKLISIYLFSILYVFSLLKFTKRILVSFFKKEFSC